jgi:hypothetical protein
MNINHEFNWLFVNRNDLMNLLNVNRNIIEIIYISIFNNLVFLFQKNQNIKMEPYVP